MKKECTKCKVEKYFINYRKGRNSCRSCNYLLAKSRPGYMESKRKSDKLYRENNKEKKVQADRKYYYSNLEKVKAKVKEYRMNNPEKVAKRKRKWEIDNRERVNELQRIYYWKDPEKARGKNLITGKKYRESNREKLNERSVLWTKNHPGVRQEAKKKWRLNNSDKVRIHQSNRKMRKKAGGGGLLPHDWKNILVRYGYKCLCCGKSGLNIELTIDHVIPLIKGGLHLKENIQPLCRTCNLRKGIKTLDYRKEISYGI